MKTSFFWDTDPDVCLNVWTIIHVNGDPTTTDCRGKCQTHRCFEIRGNIYCNCLTENRPAVRATPEAPRCECGAKAIGSPLHSSWCPLR